MGSTTHPSAWRGRIARAAVGVLGAVVLLCGCTGDDEGGANASMATEQTAADGTVFNAADVEFARAMIAHHRQTVEIADLASVPGNEASTWLVPLADRIKAEQLADIDRLQALLDSWDPPVGSGATATSDDVDGVADPTQTPGALGMMSADEMIELTTTTGGDFDRLWLAMMIRHHEGAVAMCKQLLVDGRSAQLQSLAATVSSAHQVQLSEMNAALKVVSPTGR